jgi:hypothetical protein
MAAAALAVAGFSLSSSRADDPAPNPSGDSSTTRPAMNNMEAAQIRSTLGHVTETALTKDKFSQLAAYLQLSPANRPVRAPDAKPLETGKPDQPKGGIGTTERFKNYDDLNTAIARFEQDWRDKYNSDFAMGTQDKSIILNDSFQIVRVDLNDAARQASERMSPGSANASGMEPNQVAPISERATVYVARAGGMAAMDLEMVKPLTSGDWRIEPSSAANEQNIHDTLLKHLNMMHEKRTEWPAERAAGYRAVTDQVLSAFAEAGVETSADHASSSNGNRADGNNMNRP